MTDESSYRILSSGRKLETGPSVNRVLKSGRCLTDQGPIQKKARTLYSEIGTILHSNDSENKSSSSIASKIQVSERKPRENEPTKKLLLQAVSDANKSVLMKLNKTNGVVKVMKPDGTTECLTTKTLAKRLKAKEPTWVDPTSLINRAEPSLGKMKIRIKNEYCSTTDDNKSGEQEIAPMEFADDEEDEFIVVVNNDYEAGDDINNIWMLNDYPYDDNGNNLNVNEFDDGRGSGTFKRKLSDDMMSDDNDPQQYSPPTNPLSSATNKKSKRCRFWPDCHNGEQCEFVHPTQRCSHFPNCAYGAECLYIHPPCRFGSACVKADCPYLHSSSTPASSPSSTNNNNIAAAIGRSSITNRPESLTICKFGVQCMRPNCMYSHPRMPFPSARNFKWVNNKWHAASDDISLLPPPAKNIVYENPFITDKTSTNKTSSSSNQNDVEK